MVVSVVGVANEGDDLVGGATVEDDAAAIGHCPGWKLLQAGGSHLLVWSDLFFVFGLTIRFNAPLNIALPMASRNPAAIVGTIEYNDSRWAKYLNRIFWNHIRMVTAIASSALLMWA
jgi:uncharacterized membrane protein